MRNEFKSVKAYSKTWRKVIYIRESLRFMGYHLSKSNILEIGIDMLAKSCKAKLEKIQLERDGTAQ